MTLARNSIRNNTGIKPIITHLVELTSLHQNRVSRPHLLPYHITLETSPPFRVVRILVRLGETKPLSTPNLLLAINSSRTNRNSSAKINKALRLIWEIKLVTFHSKPTQDRRGSSGAMTIIPPKNKTK